MVVVVSCIGLGYLLQFLRESAALTYLETKPDKTFSPLRVSTACTAFTADWLLPVVDLRVTNQMVLCVGQCWRQQTESRGCISAKITQF